MPPTRSPWLGGSRAAATIAPAAKLWPWSMVDTCCWAVRLMRSCERGLRQGHFPWGHAPNEVADGF